MHRTFQEIMLAAFLGLVVPGIILGAAVNLQEEEPTQPTQTPAIQEEVQPKSALSVNVTMSDGTVQTMDLDTYLVGVVLAEMPASFELEALKAQAVVARTYTLKCVGAGKHDGGVCTDYTCCQAYVAEENYGGNEESLEKVRSAVLATSGQVLTYQGNLIEATYFSCSGGMTEDAVAVWGTDYPYLRSVESPGEENAAYYTDTVTFTAEEFQTALGQELSGSPSGWFGFTTYTAGGGVNTMRIGGVDYKGTELRTLLGLRSTVFSISVDGQNIAITTKGFGHRVGMSQYGADAMAVAGSNYEQILTYYYSGTALAVYEN